MDALLNSLMDARTIQIVGKVDITYSDASVDPTITATSPNTQEFTQVNQIIDGQLSVTRKYFALSNNKLDGTFHPLSTDGLEQVGWWSNVLSDASCVFISPPSLSVLFASRTVFTIEVTGDVKSDIYPVDFTVSFYNNLDQLINTETITGNTSCSFFRTLTAQVDNVVKSTLTITKNNKPFNNVRICEFFTPIRYSYEGSELEGIDLLEELEYDSGEVKLGAVSANEITIGIKNSDNLFDINNLASPIHSFLKKKRKIDAFLGVVYTPETTMWKQLGTFWSFNWNVPKNALIAQVTARDLIENMRTSDFYRTSVFFNASVYNLFAYILADFGLTTDQFVIDDTLKTTIIPCAWFSKGSHRDALVKIAQCVLVSVYVNRSNQVVVSTNTPTTEAQYTFSESLNTVTTDYPQAWDSLANYVEVTALARTIGTSQIVFSSNEIIEIAPGDRAYRLYPYTMDPVAVIDTPAVITTNVNLYIESYQHYSWGVAVTFLNAGVTTDSVLSINTTGTPLIADQNSVTVVAKDDNLIRDEGVVRVSIAPDFVQTEAYAQILSAQILDKQKDSRYNVVLECNGHIGLVLNDKIAVADNLNEYALVRQELHWDGALDGRVEGRVL